eukprot:5602065-Pyramimonas_sp.AAC.1
MPATTLRSRGSHQTCGGLEQRPGASVPPPPPTPRPRWQAEPAPQPTWSVWSEPLQFGLQIFDGL